jgi:hypothetical protein
VPVAMVGRFGKRMGDRDRAGPPSDLARRFRDDPRHPWLGQRSPHSGGPGAGNACQRGVPTG